MYVPINSSSKLIQNHNSLKSTFILFNTKRGKEFLFTFEHFSVKRLDQCCLYFQIWYFNKSCFGFVYVGPARHVESSFYF